MKKNEKKGDEYLENRKKEDKQKVFSVFSVERKRQGDRKRENR